MEGKGVEGIEGWGEEENDNRYGSYIRIYVNCRDLWKMENKSRSDYVGEGGNWRWDDGDMD